MPFVIAVMVMFLTSLFILNYYQKTEQKEFENRVNKQLSNQFNQEIKNDIEQLTGFLSFIANNRVLQQEYKQKNRADLLLKSTPIFEELRSQHQITHFYFHDLDGNNYLRVHSPDRYGDQISRATLNRTIQASNRMAGLEFGTFGQFVIRVVIPWKIDNQLVGYLELGKEIDHVIKRLSINNDFQLILVIHKDFIFQNNLDKTDFFQSKANLLAKNKNIFIINQTINQISPSLRAILDTDGEMTNQTYNDAEREYLISKIAINDFQKGEIASLYYLVDMSLHAQHQQELTHQVSMAGLAIGGLLFLFYFFYSKRLEILLRTSYEDLDTEIAQRQKVQVSLTESKEKLENLVQQRDLSLDQSNKRYQTLFDKTADALLIIEGHRFIDCNQAALEMLGFTNKDDLYNTHPSKLSPEVQPDGEKSGSKADLMIEIAFKEGSHRFEWEHKRKNGEIFPVEVLLTAIPFDGSQLLHVVWRDISARKTAAAEIEHQAYYDALTGLPNRKLLIDRLQQTYITSRRRLSYSALLFIDMDRFKSINDSLGHSVGDNLLIESAKRIQSAVWDEDTVARFGGDEYVILLKNLGKNKQTASLHAKKIATRIQSTFIPAFLIDNQELHITLSIGIALFPLHQKGIDDILKQADTAMYSAKDNGRNQIAFYLSEMHEKVIKRLSLEKDLRAAIKQHQLEVYYQPQFNLSGTIIAVEALLRWRHQQHGFINPEEFIAIAEDTGLIYDIGEFVLTRSIIDILGINKEYDLKLNLSVNISPHQFKKDEFVGQIKKLMENHQLDKDFLTLEVTEGVAIDNLNHTIEKFEQLRHVGARLSLDDFGTGYSSLSHLKRLPINELKIDKSFVFDIQDDPQDALLVQTIINIGHRFGLEVVAEGVESKEQLAFLQQQHCDIYQGYYYSRPLPLDMLRDFIQVSA